MSQVVTAVRGKLRSVFEFPPGFSAKQPVGRALKRMIVALAAMQLVLAIVRVANESSPQIETLQWTVVYLVLEFAGFLFLALRPGFAWIPFTLECAVLIPFTSPGVYAFLIPVFLILACFLAPLPSLIPIMVGFFAWMFGWPMSNGVSLVDFVSIYGVIWLVAVFMGLSCRIIAVRERQGRQRLDAEALSRANAISAHKRELARELHDVIAHHLTIIAVRARVGEQNPSVGALQTELHDIGDVSRFALADLRNLLATMREPGEESLGTQSLTRIELPTELEQAAASLRGYGIECQVRIEGNLEDIPLAHRPTLRRFVQECVTNVFKHGDTTKPCSFTLSVSETETSIKSSNGVASVADRGQEIGSSGYGLIGLRERAGALNGSVRTRLSEINPRNGQPISARPSAVRIWNVEMTLPHGAHSNRAASIG